MNVKEFAILVGKVALAMAIINRVSFAKALTSETNQVII